VRPWERGLDAWMAGYTVAWFVKSSVMGILVLRRRDGEEGGEYRFGGWSVERFSGVLSPLFQGKTKIIKFKICTAKQLHISILARKGPKSQWIWVAATTSGRIGAVPQSISRSLYSPKGSEIVGYNSSTKVE